jgi:Na+/proline symporter
MTLFGLHYLDWLVIILYLVLMILIGAWARKKITGTRAFYQGGRSFGKVLSTFLSFGSITSSDHAFYYAVLLVFLRAPETDPLCWPRRHVSPPVRK